MSGIFETKIGRLARKLPAFGLVGVLVLLSGCGASVARKTVAVQPPVTPITWNADMKEGLTATPVADATLAKWWTVLKDPVLTRLIEQAVQGNLDLRQAEARVREARARRASSQADRFPTLQFSPSARGNSNAESNSSFYAMGFDASWEADLFGAKRKTVEAADISVQASVEDLRDVLVSLSAEVALNYLEVRTYQTRLDNAADNVKFQEETYDIARWRFEAGLTTQLDVDQARSNLEQTRAQIPTLRAGLEQAKNRIAILTGQERGNPEADCHLLRPPLTFRRRLFVLLGDIRVPLLQLSKNVGENIRLTARTQFPVHPCQRNSHNIAVVERRSEFLAESQPHVVNELDISRPQSRRMGPEVDKSRRTTRSDDF